ncbi:GNAT family N-acetyltransferase [Terrimonas sp. NA20]|uniref:GNAT family N-acetyltransferase n=1 Tax=Terrimonas ginsenosidimutans TaxID=2908004 RepID=A0ABS9KP32_9BACT|nr:GNAT family N-acetyltransferase [Terrimonas ginsenosidimutans]MCG2614082.1 GNAT family N-acetyltransferase [Terrimonas ginsenosidimutans]
MEDLLYNPVYNALLLRDAHLGAGTDRVKYFDEAVSPFVGFPTNYSKGFSDLYDLFPSGRRILYATPEPIEQPPGWQVVASIPGLQFVFTADELPQRSAVTPVLLDGTNVEEMIQLAQLTKPGPFSLRTIEFGHYYGVFENGRLAAMTGQRLHPGNYSEVSAVCTHPDHLGKGFAAALITHQLYLIREQGQRAFLHSRDDNERAIALYKRLGFTESRPMHFYFMKRV